MVVKEEVEVLRAENEELRRQLAVAFERISDLEERLAELEGRQGGSPSFVKPNRPKANKPKKPRKKRDPQHNHGRPREMPTRTVQQALSRCPRCHYRLNGKSLDYARQVIEIPEPQPVEVIEHQVIKRYCPHCQCWQSPKLDLKGQVLGQGRIGVRLAGLMVYLRQSLRMTVRPIEEYLETLHHFKVSLGEIVEPMHDVRQATADGVAELKRQMWQSRVLHADETGWRENGRSGYIWSFSSPGEAGVRYYEYDPSRSHKVVERILDEKFKGHLVSDFYCGYNDYGGKKQRCLESR